MGRVFAVVKYCLCYFFSLLQKNYAFSLFYLLFFIFDRPLILSFTVMYSMTDHDAYGRILKLADSDCVSMNSSILVK